MCPNCILNQAGLQTGVYISFGICAMFFLMAIFAMGWAFKNGEFDDIEGAKFDMLDDSDDSLLIKQAKKRVEFGRSQAASE